MINLKCIIIFTSFLLMMSESKPFGDLLRTLISGHLYRPHTRIIDHHHYYTDDADRRHDYVHGPYHVHQEHQHGNYHHPPHGELLHRIHSDNHGTIICCRVNPLQPYYKNPPVNQHIQHDASDLHTEVIYHGHESDNHHHHHHHHHPVVDCGNKNHLKEQDDNKHKKEHDDKHQLNHDDKNHGGQEHNHHEDHSDGHHDNKHNHHGDHSNEHHDNKHHGNQDKHEDEHHKDHSDEQHEENSYEHNEDATSAIDELKLDQNPSYEVFESVSDVPKESFFDSNATKVSKKTEDNAVLR